MGAKVTKVFSEEYNSDLNTTKESSPEKNSCKVFKAKNLNSRDISVK